MSEPIQYTLFDSAPYRRTSDPTTSYAGAREVAAREGRKRLIRPNTGRHIAAEMLLDHPYGISGLDAGKAMIRYGIGATSQDPANIGRRRLNELAEYGGADRVDNLYLPNPTTRRIVEICRAGGTWEAP